MIRSTIIEPSDMKQPDSSTANPNDPQALKQMVLQFKKRAETAEQKLAVAKRELVNLLTKSEAEQNSKTRELNEKILALNTQCQLHQSEVERLTEQSEEWRLRYFDSEQMQTNLRERLEHSKKKLGELNKPVPVEARDPDAPTSVYVDPLTEVGNEAELQKRLKKSLQRSHSGECLSVLMIFDIDRFSSVNELGGWDCGNDFLVQVAQRLKSLVGDSAPICRRGEDEFAVLVDLERPKTQVLGSEASRLQARQFADMLFKQFDSPFSLAGRPSSVTVSMGISLAPDDADTPNEMLENAHLALTQAKRQGKAQYRFYNDSLHEAKEFRISRTLELENALDEKAFQALFAPIVEVGTGALAGAELELYWNHERYGRVGLTDLIPQVEEMGRAAEFFDFELNCAADLARKLRGSLPVIIPVPSTVLAAENFVKRTLEAISRFRLKPEGFALEVDARTSSLYSERTLQVFRELAHWKVGRSVGGLGSGSLPLNLLAEGLPSMGSLAPETLVGVPGDPNRTVLVQGLIKLFRELRIPLRITGVEDKTQAHFLANYEAQLASGIFLLPGMTADDLMNRKRTTWSFR